MLLGALTVADHFEDEKEALVAESPAWKDPFIGDFRNSVELALKEYFGINTREELNSKTSLINELTAQATDDLGMVKTQMGRGFRSLPDRFDTLLGTLGFTAYWDKAVRKNQEELIALLLAFRNNLSDELRTELEQNGVNSARITRVLGFADSLKQANITQESLKGTSKLETEKGLIALNNIYEQVMDICLIGQQLFKKDALKKDLFVFSKIIGKQKRGSASESDTTDESTNDDKA